MKNPLEPGRISRIELWFLLLGFICGTSVLLPPGAAAGRDAWAAVALGSLVGLGVAGVFMTLSLRFPDKTYVEISEQVFGRFLGKVFGGLFVWYLMHVASLILTHFSDYYSSNVFRMTPAVALVVPFALVAAYTLSGGLEVLARCSIPIVSILLILPFSDTAMVLSRVDPRRLLPMFETPPAVFLWSVLGAAALPCAEVVAFMMLFPAVSDKRGIRRTVFSVILLSGLLFGFSAARDYAVLGRTFEYYPYSIIQTIRTAEVGGILSRVEILVTSVLLAIGFIKLSVLLYGASLGLAQLLHLRSHKELIYPLSAVLVGMSLTNFGNFGENLKFMILIYPAYGLVFQLGLPLITLLAAVVRRLPAKAEKDRRPTGAVSGSPSNN